VVPSAGMSPNLGYSFSRAVAVAQTKDAIAAKVQEIFELVRRSNTPISVLGLQSTILRASRDWSVLEVEQVSAQVLGLLIKHGWKKPSA
jgi:hypothetical protein